MKSVPIGSGVITSPAAPTLNDGSAEALSAMADYEFVCTVRNLRAADYEIQWAEVSDYDSLQSDVNTFKGDFKTWLQAMPGIDDGSSPSTRDLPAQTGATWASIAQRVVSLAVAGAAGGVPGILLDLAIDVGVEMLAQYLGGKLYPGGDGSMSETNSILRKSLLIDPGVLDFERSVFVGEKGGTGFWGLAQGDFTSIGQLLLHALYRDTNDLDSSVFVLEDSGGNRISTIESLITAVQDNSEVVLRVKVNGRDHVEFFRASVHSDLLE